MEVGTLVEQIPFTVGHRVIGYPRNKVVIGLVEKASIFFIYIRCEKTDDLVKVARHNCEIL